MEKQQKKRVKKYIAWGLILALVVFLALLPMIAGKNDLQTGPQASVLQAQAELREITQSVLGGGNLVAEGVTDVTVPAEVKIREYLVRNGDAVTQGQAIATVDRVSVMTAITQVQETLDHLAEELDDIRDDTAPDEVTATAGGTVKAVYGAEGEDVQDVLLRSGALAVLSLDGKMAVQLLCESSLTGGDSVSVTFPDGTEIPGRVESNLEGTLTVTVEDEDYAPGQQVQVTDAAGQTLGTGELYVHSPWNVVAYSGTVSKVRVSEGDSVNAGKTLFELEDTGHTARFDALSRQHREYEALMLELFQMYQSENLTAPQDGIVTGVDEAGAYMLSSQAGGWTLSLLSNAPNGDDETSYIHYVGQVAQVGFDGLVINLNPQSFSVTDYKDLSAIPLDTALMTESVIYAASAPVYTLAGEEWVQLGTDAIAAGDILLFAGDTAGNFVWVIRVAGGQVPPAAEDPSQPADPDVPADPETPGTPEDTTDPSQPTDPADPTVPTDPGMPGTGAGMGMGGGSFPSMGMGVGGGMTAEEEEFETYSLETVTVATVTAQERVTLSITVDEQDVAKLSVGQTADMTVDALVGEKFTATVTAISASGENEGGSSKFTVELTAEKSADMLPGMRANVSLATAMAESVIAIPVAALQESGAQAQVYTGYDEETESYTDPVTVETGVSDGEYVQILSGLEAGQTVYYPYYDTLIVSNVPQMSGGFSFG